MRICMVTTFYPPAHHGGDGVFVRGLARALVARGHHVEVVHCEDAFRLGGGEAGSCSDADDDGVTVHALRSRWGAISPLITQQTGRPGLKRARLAEILDRDFDVVNFHNISLVGGLGVLAMSRAPVTLYTLHEHWLICPTHILWKNKRKPCDKPHCVTCCLRSGIPPQWWRWTGMRERALRHVNALLSPSEFTAARHRNELSVPIHVLPTFSCLDPESPPRHRSDDGPPRFLFVGRVTESKGIRELVDEFRRTPQRALRVVGRGDLLDELRRRCADAPNVSFPGWLSPERIAEEYRSACALVLPSLAPEVFPLCVLEAFACGTPVIVRDAGGNREAVERTGAGFVYRDRAQLREAIAKLAGDAELRNDLGARGRDGYEVFYNADRYVDDYLELIAGIQARTREAVTA